MERQGFNFNALLKYPEVSKGIELVLERVRQEHAGGHTLSATETLRITSFQSFNLPPQHAMVTIHRKRDDSVVHDGIKGRHNAFFIIWREGGENSPVVATSSMPSIWGVATPMDLIRRILEVSSHQDTKEIRFFAVIHVTATETFDLHWISVHVHEDEWWRERILENPALLDAVVKKHTRINNSEVELTREMLLLGYFTD